MASVLVQIGTAEILLVNEPGFTIKMLELLLVPFRVSFVKMICKRNNQNIGRTFLSTGRLQKIKIDILQKTKNKKSNLLFCPITLCRSLSPTGVQMTFEIRRG